MAIFEAETGVKNTEIDQLDTAGNPHYAGVFLPKILITGGYLTRAHKALTAAQEVKVIELPSCTDHVGLSSGQKRMLIQSVQQALSG